MTNSLVKLKTPSHLFRKHALYLDRKPHLWIQKKVLQNLKEPLTNLERGALWLKDEIYL